MVAYDIKPKQEEAQIPNQILRLLDALPRRISNEIEVLLREEFRGKWFQTWRNPEYNPARIRAADMMRLKVIFQVPDEFFLGTAEEINDIIRTKVVEHQFTGVTA